MSFCRACKIYLCIIHANTCWFFVFVLFCFVFVVVSVHWKPQAFREMLSRLTLEGMSLGVEINERDTLKRMRLAQCESVDKNCESWAWSHIIAASSPSYDVRRMNSNTWKTPCIVQLSIRATVFRANISSLAGMVNSLREHAIIDGLFSLFTLWGHFVIRSQPMLVSCEPT